MVCAQQRMRARQVTQTMPCATSASVNCTFGCCIGLWKTRRTAFETHCQCSRRSSRTLAPFHLQPLPPTRLRVRCDVNLTVVWVGCVLLSVVGKRDRCSGHHSRESVALGILSGFAEDAFHCGTRHLGSNVRELRGACLRSCSCLMLCRCLQCCDIWRLSRVFQRNDNLDARHMGASYNRLHKLDVRVLTVGL